jgi:hypothetical protein
MIAELSLSLVSILWAGTVVADEPAESQDKPEQTAPAAQEPKPPAKPETTKPRAPGDDDLLKALEKKSAPAEVDDENPLLRVGQRMRDVQGRLAKADPGDETQTLQKGIVDDIDTLIEQLKKAGGQSSKQQQQKRNTSNPSANQKQQGQPNQASEPNENDVSFKPGQVSDERMKANERLVRAIWGHLPEKLREEMQQAFKEADLPKYRPLIDQYFKAIAEQKDSRR